MDDAPQPSLLQQEVFFAALERDDPGARADFLDHACEGQPELRRWVEEEIHKQIGVTHDVGVFPMMQAAPEDTAWRQTSPETEALLASLKPEEAGDYIGVYKLLEPLGEGGFGDVWKAGQEQPVRRQVALKIIRLGMNSREIMARFAQERQALAMMDHPGIAKVFDAGTTPFGRPYFAMELVRGVPITDYSEAERLPIAQRLELFVQVCLAVQHAHQKGIIHRDLKPSNVLVALHDGVPTPKVIDFGIAKATQQQRLTELTLVTQADFFLGTPLYMSPEQIGGGGTDIDTRSDIYSLGVMLYTLLTGHTPIDPETLEGCDFDEMIRRVRDEDLPRPTTRLRGLSPAALLEVTQTRRSSAARLMQTVRGDLEWICMKALEKDRRRRYASVNALATDIQHFLLNEPVTAHPPSRLYVLRKLATRHRRTFTAAGMIFLTILLGLIFGWREAVRAKRSEQRAMRARAEESRQHQHAVGQALHAEQEAAAARLSEYAADLDLAHQSILAGDLGRAAQLLDKHRPAPGEPDLRGFSWRYLQRLALGDEHTAFASLGEPASALAFSSDGKLLAVGGTTKVIVSDVQSRQPLATLHVGAGTLAFLPGGKLLVAVDKGTVHLWRTTDWSEQGSWVDGTASGALSPDGMHLAVVCPDGVRVRSTVTWQEERFLPGAASPIAFSPNGKMLAGDSVSGLTLWRLDNGKGLVLTGSAGLFSNTALAFFHPVRSIVFTPDGTTLIAPQNWLSDRGIFLLRAWNTVTGQEMAAAANDPNRPEHTGAIAALAISPDGSLLATTSLDHTVRLWDRARRASIATLKGHHAEVIGCAFSPDGQTVATCDRLGQVYAWPVQRGKVEDTLPGVVRVLGFSKDGKTLAVLTQDNAVVFYDADTKEPGRRFLLEKGPAGVPTPVAVSASLRLVVQGLEDGYVKVWNTETAEVRKVISSDRAVDLVAFAADDETLISGSPGRPLNARNLRTGKDVSLPFEAQRVAISPDGQLLTVISSTFASTNSPAHGRAVNGSALKELPADGPPVDIPDLEPSVSHPKGTSLWDLATSTLRARLAVESRYITDGAFSPDGHLFAAAISDNTIQLWDTKAGGLMGICKGHKQVVTAVAISPDGKTLASASEDGTLRLWNVATQQEFFSVPDLGDRVRELNFSPDNRMLVATCVLGAHAGQLRFYCTSLEGKTESTAGNGVREQQISTPSKAMVP